MVYDLSLSLSLFLFARARDITATTRLVQDLTECGVTHTLWQGRNWRDWCRKEQLIVTHNWGGLALGAIESDG